MMPLAVLCELLRPHPPPPPPPAPAPIFPLPLSLAPFPPFCSRHPPYFCPAHPHTRVYFGRGVAVADSPLQLVRLKAQSKHDKSSSSNRAILTDVQHQEPETRSITSPK